jgi:hypothetical protein
MTVRAIVKLVLGVLVIGVIVILTVALISDIVAIYGRMYP